MKTVKNCFENAFDNFSGKGDVLCQKLTTFFYHKRVIKYFIIYQFFQKKLQFSEKTTKTVSGTQISFEG